MNTVKHPPGHGLGCFIWISMKGWSSSTRQRWLIRWGTCNYWWQGGSVHAAQCHHPLLARSGTLATSPRVIQPLAQNQPHQMAGNSPDLNPRETVWAWMKNQLTDINCKNMVEWKREISLLWVMKMDGCQYPKNLLGLMPRRMQQIIGKDNDVTKY